MCLSVDNMHGDLGRKEPRKNAPRSVSGRSPVDRRIGRTGQEKYAEDEFSGSTTKDPLIDLKKH